MNLLEQYLHQATKGIWGRKKLEVREELTAHILERNKKHQLAGLSEQAALEQTLLELGQPQAIAQGIRQTDWKRPLTLGLMVLFILSTSPKPIKVSTEFTRSTRLLGAQLIPIPLAQKLMAQVTPIPLAKREMVKIIPILRPETTGITIKPSTRSPIGVQR